MTTRLSNVAYEISRAARCRLGIMGCPPHEARSSQVLVGNTLRLCRPAEERGALSFDASPILSQPLPYEYGRAIPVLEKNEGARFLPVTFGLVAPLGRNGASDAKHRHLLRHPDEVLRLGRTTVPQNPRCASRCCASFVGHKAGEWYDQRPGISGVLLP